MLSKSWVGKAACRALALLVWQAGAIMLGQSVLLVTPVRVYSGFHSCDDNGFLENDIIQLYQDYIRLYTCSGGGQPVRRHGRRFKAVETLQWPWLITFRSVPVASFIILSLIWLSSRQLPVFISFLIGVFLLFIPIYLRA
jgi:NitT/TauT family transport system permease protein